MRRLSTFPSTCVVALAVAASLAGCGGGDDDKRKIRANEVDMAFATEMLDHHERGIDAADLAPSRAEDRVVRRAARELIQLQSPEVQVLRVVRRVLSEGGVDRGELGVPQTLDPEELRGADDFDAAYAAAMIVHHEAAIRMSAVERHGGVHAELRRMAEDITDLARFQIRQLERSGRQ